MKSRYILPLVGIAFVGGMAMSQYQLRVEIEETDKAVKAITGQMEQILASQEEYRAISDLETTIDTIGSIVAISNRGAPRKYIGEEYTAMLKKRMTALESLAPQLKDGSNIKKSDFLLQKGKELLKEVEFNYL